MILDSDVVQGNGKLVPIYSFDLLKDSTVASVNGMGTIAPYGMMLIQMSQYVSQFRSLTVWGKLNPTYNDEDVTEIDCLCDPELEKYESSKVSTYNTYPADLMEVGIDSAVILLMANDLRQSVQTCILRAPTK